MFWRKRKKTPEERKDELVAKLNDLGMFMVSLARDTVQLTLPKGTIIDAFASGVGAIELPDAHDDIIYSVSSYDISLHGLEDVRPAEAALGQGEELCDPPSQKRTSMSDQDDYSILHFVTATDGPYAEHGGYFMRLFLHEGRYLRAVRFAVTDERDLERGIELLGEIGIATDTTAIDRDQKLPDVARAFAGSHYSLALPPGWTVAPLEDDEDDPGTSSLVCIAPDEKAFARVVVTHGFTDNGQFAPEDIEDLLDRHIDIVSPTMEATLSSPAVVLERTADCSLVAARDPARDPDGTFQQSYAMQHAAPHHIVHVEYHVQSASDDMTEADWHAVIAALEPCIRAANIYHPYRYVVGEDR